jgi:phosphoglycolate phosphatase
VPQPPLPDLRRLIGLVFDLDGTLVDSYPAITSSVNRARTAFGLDPMEEQEVRKRVGHGLERLMAELVGPERAPEGVHIFREHYARVYADGTRARPGALTTLRELRRRGYRLSVASNKPARFGRLILSHLGMLEHLDAVQGPDLAGTTKPEPTMIRLCLEAMSALPGEAAYVGDMTLDVESAREAGLPVMLVTGGSTPEAELRSTGHRVLGSLRELLIILPARARLGAATR